MFEFLKRESPPIVIGHSPPAPSTVSSSYVSDVTNIDDDKKENGCQEEQRQTRVEILMQPRFWPTSDEQLRQHSAGTDREEERSSRRVVPNKNERPIPRREGEEMDGAGVTTALVLFQDPWKIKKKLTERDLGHSSRLLIPRGCVRTHVLPQMGEGMVRRVESRDGMEVAVWDADTGDEYRLVFRYWASSKSYVLNGGWNKLFVKGRGWQVGDEIGMLWIPSLTDPMPKKTTCVPCRASLCKKYRQPKGNQDIFVGRIRGGQGGHIRGGQGGWTFTKQVLEAMTTADDIDHSMTEAPFDVAPLQSNEARIAQFPVVLV
ncbi:hypothetical protein NL676_009158 [Syzygium grande]|nr:hypothetical protein NL676_009158 [Syzygium grande]